MSDRDQRFSEQSDSQQPAPLDQTAPQDKSVPAPAAVNRTEQILNRVHNKIGRLHLFAAFCENPANVTFQTQEADEKVLLFLRKSQWVNVPWFAITALLLLLPLFVYYVRGSFSAFLPSANIIFVSIALYYLLVALYAFVNFITWYYNAAIISNKRIIDIDFHQLVYKDVAETKLALVQDVSYNQMGVLPNILGYGFVLIQTAGTLDNFEFHALPQPARVEEVVEALIGGKRFYEP